MTIVAIVGAQWGDEGKGKVVDLLAEKADLVVRFHGGNNAGHTLVVDSVAYALHLVPSGVLHPGKTSLIASGTVVDPDALLQEIAELTDRGVAVGPDRLKVSDRAHVILPQHRLLDVAREAQGSDARLGTTGRGIGPAYEDKAARVGLRLGELRRLDDFRRRLERALVEKNFLLTKLYGMADLQVPSVEAIMERAKVWAEKLKPYLVDSAELVKRASADGRRILFEGAQGVQLDLDHGTYPFVTSSNPTAGGVCVGAGLPPRALDHVLGLVKAYTTRVGEGPLPTELHGELGERLRKAGREYGTTTGRPRRCGWLDALAVRRAVELCGIDHLAVTKLDVLQGLPELKIATHYELDGRRIDFMPADADDLARCRPVYESWPGFEADISKIRRLGDLPSEARAYLDRLGELAGAPPALISVGPDREETIVVHQYF
ncbi:MAG: adenylosuccinate synthase [Deltaproteobacteria bacterium]|jgi:adenylosuccinate synthase|nr:adenylosuccinate synthase [Deltaproteobacteria bacterium]